MNGDEDFPCFPRTGRRLWTLRARDVAWRCIDRLLHRGHVRDQHRFGNTRACWYVDDLYAERFVHDQRFHDHVMARSVKAS